MTFTNIVVISIITFTNDLFNKHCSKNIKYFSINFKPKKNSTNLKFLYVNYNRGYRKIVIHL